MATTTRKIAPFTRRNASARCHRPRAARAAATNARESATTLGKKLGIARTTVIRTHGAVAERRRHHRLQRAPQPGDAGKSLQAYVGLSVAARAGRDVMLKRLAEDAGDQAGVQRRRRVRLRGVARADSPNALDRLLDEIGEIEGVSKDHHLGGAGRINGSIGGGVAVRGELGEP